MASSQSSKIISIKELITKYKGQIDINELDQLMALVLHKNIAYIYKNPDKQLSRSNILAFKKILNKRLANYSLAYLKKNKEFYKLNFIVNKHTLIPRPDSELIIEEALKNTSNNQNIIDIGTGSGALILSLAKNNKHTANYIATDISTKALDIAKTNARKLKLKNKIKFIKTNLLDNISEQFDIIIANLPYLTPVQMQEASIKKEPVTALLSGQDGLDHYKKLLKQLPKYLNKKYLILLEIDPAQEKLIKKEIIINLPQANIKFLKDLANNIRIVKITN
ncbi:MAG: peptide chain release factor N(5)-glutamine methyltransferase [Candidatus Komeilibacteria bacterium]|jgi:release factor glutamine methyltransferase|nr:peptide chain release factor N(5)-glutamine methyltransferase [Candidatus Komeilibacteria bacterium]MBT4447893.1 peptide chain release factor N(5)-glutamine methyltransferase [Candidatus Komeilibacteria bacterium]